VSINDIRLVMLLSVATYVILVLPDNDELLSSMMGCGRSIMGDAWEGDKSFIITLINALLNRQSYYYYYYVNYVIYDI
jgi:hypothetical protein